MKTQEILESIVTRKGQNTVAVWGKSLKTRKDVEHNVEKVTRILLRSGIDYDNQKAVIEARESGELPAENSGLPWGEWKQYPYVIEHKGSEYVRFYLASGKDIKTGENFRPVTEYYLDGELTTKEIIEPFCLASEFQKSKSEPLCYTVKSENVRAILI